MCIHACVYACDHRFLLLEKNNFYNHSIKDKCTGVCVCMHVCVTLCLYVHMFVCVCVYLYVYLYVCVCVCTVPSRSLHAAILQPGPDTYQHGSVLAVHHLKYSHRFLVVLVHRACCQHMEAVFCVMYINTSIQIT